MENRHHFRAFVSPLAVPHRAPCSISSSVCAPTFSVPNATTPTRKSVTSPKMEQATAVSRKDKGKKRAAPTFATDIKGNIVWTLRSATAEDIDAVYPLVEHLLPRPLVEAFLSESPCCTVCEASTKGSKEGEGFTPGIFGIVLVDINEYFKDDPALKDKKTGYLVTIVVDEDVPDSETGKKLLLGSLKKMKSHGVIEVNHITDKPPRIELIKQCLFKEDGKSEFEIPLFTCKLAFENPDPQKKLL